VGTPAYMSPEQAMGDRALDARSDIYALGVVGYQMLAGELPHQAANTPSMLMKHISERPRALGEVRPDLPANLVYAIERAMAKGRDDRWPDAGAFRDALADAAPPPPQGRASSGVIAAPDPRPFAVADPIEQSPAYPRFPALPQGWMLDPNAREYGREALREWKEETRRWRERYGRQAVIGARIGRKELRRARREGLFGPQTPEDRIRRVQRAFFGGLGMVGFLATINLITSPQYPWFIFPAAFIGLSFFVRMSRLWTDGIPLHRIFQRQPQVQPPPAGALAAATASAYRPASSSVATPRPDAPELAGIPRDVLEGPQGAPIRDAVNAKATIADVLSKLSPADRQMLPEIQPTVDALVERICSLAQGLHQLDADASPAAIATLERRIADAKAGPPDAPDLERRLQLLERQHATLKDLAARRVAVAEQLERASLVLQTMKLDLFKLRSSGLDARLDASTGATQEARALSTDIGRVIDAANEVRKL
ncbi:MAG: hypothetical protein ACHQQR_07330, partial [Gemmatimonadales bacterium]